MGPGENMTRGRDAARSTQHSVMEVWVSDRFSNRSW